MSQYTLTIPAKQDLKELLDILPALILLLLEDSGKKLNSNVNY